MEEDTRPDLQTPIAGVLHTFELTGVVLNLFSIYILWKGETKRPVPAIHYYLTAILLWQSSTLFSKLIRVPNEIRTNSKIVAYYRLFSFYYYYASSAARLWLMLAMTVDRFLALCHPLKHRRMGSRSVAKKAIKVLSIAALLLQAHSLLQFKVVWICVRYVSTNRTECFYGPIRRPEYTKINIEVGGIIRIVHLIEFVFVYIGPRVIVAILSVKIVMTLVGQFKERKLLISEGKQVPPRSNETELASLLLIAKSGLGSLIFACIYIYSFTVIYTSLIENSWLVVFPPIFSEVVNMSTNFFVFLIFGQKFRKTCKEVAVQGWNRMMAVLPLARGEDPHHGIELLENERQTADNNE